MKLCKTYLIKCPWSLGETGEERSCFGKQEICDMWNKEYEHELPKGYEKAKGLRKELGVKRFDMSLKKLESKLFDYPE